MTFKERPETTMDNIISGVTRLSWEDSAARNLLLQIMEEYPDADHRIWAQHLRERASEEIAEFIFLYFVVRNARALKSTTEPKRKHRLRYGRSASARGETIRARIHGRLLDMIMPNGKPLRDCTGTECTQFGKDDVQRGQWLLRLGDEVGPRQRVGEVLSEKQVSALKRTTASEGVR